MTDLDLRRSIGAVLRTPTEELSAHTWVFSPAETAVVAELLPRLRWPAHITGSERITTQERLDWLHESLDWLRVTAPGGGRLGSLLAQCSEALEPSLGLRVEDCGRREDLTDPGPLMDAELALGQLRVLLAAGADAEVGL